ncbi:MAG: hypothetical protein WBC91_25865, partial [Phototrophicaceae bacterium]
QLVDDQLFEGEELIWWGRPIPAYTLRQTKILPLLPQLFIIAFAIFFITMSQNMFSDGFGRNDDSLFRVIPILFLLVPGFMIFTAVWQLSKPARDWYQFTRTTYALTNKRAMIITHFNSTQVQSFYDEQMKQLQVTNYGNGIGTIIFSTQTKTRQVYSGRSGSLNMNFTDDGVNFSSGRQQRTMNYQVEEGFYAISNVRVVEDFITQIFFDDEKEKSK